MSTPEDRWTEPGCSVTDDGRIVYAWPPEGRFAEMWERIAAAVPEEDRSAAVSLLNRWRDENDTLVAYTDETGEWVDVEPDWDVPKGWLD